MSSTKTRRQSVSALKKKNQAKIIQEKQLKKELEEELKKQNNNKKGPDGEKVAEKKKKGKQLANDREEFTIKTTLGTLVRNKVLKKLIKDTIRNWSKWAILASANAKMKIQDELHRGNYRWFDNKENAKLDVFFKQITPGYSQANVPPVTGPFLARMPECRQALAQFKMNRLHNTMNFKINEFTRMVQLNLILQGPERLRSFLKSYYTEDTSEDMSEELAGLHNFLFCGANISHVDPDVLDKFQSLLGVGNDEIFLMRDTYRRYRLDNDGDYEPQDKCRWFRLFPFYHKLLVACEARGYRLFPLVPIYHDGLAHFRFDSRAIHGLVSSNVAKGVNWDKNRNDFGTARNWKKYFRTKRLETENQKFNCSIMTDGIQVSVLMRRPKVAYDELNRRKQRYIERCKERMEAGNRYTHEIGIDPGKKYFFGATKIPLPYANEVELELNAHREENFLMSSKTYNYECGMKRRKKLRLKLTGAQIGAVEKDRQRRENELNADALKTLRVPRAAKEELKEAKEGRTPQAKGPRTATRISLFRDAYERKYWTHTYVYVHEK